VETTTTIDDFKKGRWMKSSAIIKEYEHAYHELGGAIEVLRNNNVTLLPVFYTETTPGGMITEETYKQLLTEVTRELATVLPIDGCFVVPHGAAVATKHPDMDGDWLEEVRNIIGNDVPIVGTLDPHANVSQKMMDLTQGLFPYKTNPHVDQRETGRRAASFLLSILRQKKRTTQHLWQAPLAISIERQCTEKEPCKSLYSFAERLCHEVDDMHVGIVLGFPYADVPEMGTSAIIITEDPNKARYVKEQLQSYTVDHLTEFAGKPEAPRTTLERIGRLKKPLLLLDMGDNVGGGTFGNSTFLLELVDQTPHSCFICIFDPQAVKLCLNRFNGESFQLSFGCNPQTRKPYISSVTLISIHEGKFTELKPRHGGQLNYDMGPSAIVETSTGNTVLLHSKRVPPFSLSQLTSCNINPLDFDVIIAKGVNAPIAAYAEVCPDMLHVYTPGPSQADMTDFQYKNRRKPLYPFEDQRPC